MAAQHDEATLIELELIQQGEDISTGKYPSSLECLKITLETIGSKLLAGSFVSKGMQLAVPWNMSQAKIMVNQVQSEELSCDLLEIVPDTCIRCIDSETAVSSATCDRQLILEQFHSQKVGGMTKEAQILIDMVLLGLNWNLWYDGDRPVWPSHGALIHGRPGSGKTLLVRSVCAAIEDNVRSIFVSAPEIFQKNLIQTEAYMEEIVNQAIKMQPSVLVIDEIESIGSPNCSSFESNVLAFFLSQLDRIRQEKFQVFVIGVTAQRSQMNNILCCHGRLDTHVFIRPPDSIERIEILQRLTQEMVSIESDIIQDVALHTAGYNGADLLKLCRESAMLCIQRGDSDIVKQDFFDAMQTVRPSILQKSYEVKIPDVSMSTFVGLDDQIALLRASILMPLNSPERFSRMGVSPPRGVLLYGPSGSGKTALAQAIATEARGKATFLPVNCTEIISKVVGDTEKAIGHIFETAREAAPCILFFDQLEALAPPRGHDSSTEHTFDRLLSTLLIEMDGVGSGEIGLSFEKHVLVLATTTSRDNLDPTILRPGRLDQHIQLHLPDQQARSVILERKLGAMSFNLSPETENGIASIQELSGRMAIQTEQCSGAELENYCREIALAALRRDISTIDIQLEDVQKALPWFS